MISKEEQLEQAKKARDKRRGVYKTWSRTDSYKDLMQFIEAQEANYTAGAKKAIGSIDGKPTNLTNDQRMALLDKADGIGIIKMYIQNNIS